MKWSAAAPLAISVLPALGAEGECVQITGEVIDTWCYYSGVMGAPEATLGTAHHTSAIWCAAGGIPVGILSEDGTVYMVVKWQGDPQVTGDTMLSVQSHEVVDNGITNPSHEQFGVTPDFAIPPEVTDQ